MFNPVKSPSFPLIPSDFRPCHRLILSPDPSLCARRNTRRRRRRSSGTVVPVRYHVYAAIFSCMLNRTSLVVFTRITYIPVCSCFVARAAADHRCVRRLRSRRDRDCAVCCQRCSMRDTDSYNRAIRAENDLFDPHRCVVLSVSMRMSLLFEIVFCACPSWAEARPLHPLSPQSPTHGR